MARKRVQRQPKKLIAVFWEGQTEKMYIESFCKEKFQDKAIFLVNTKKGLFDIAENCLKNNANFSKYQNEIDEIWFFFDTEKVDQSKWNDYYKVIKKLMGSKNHQKNIRLLMTTSCIEYFFLLHYKKTSPQIRTKSDKDAIIKQLSDCLGAEYQKANKDLILKISEKYQDGINNGNWSLNQIFDNSSSLVYETPLQQYEFLFKNDYSFSNVQQSLEFLLDYKSIFDN